MKSYFEQVWNLCFVNINEADFIYEKLGTHHLKFIKFRNFYFVLDKEYCLIGGIEFTRERENKIRIINIYDDAFSSGFWELICFCILSSGVKNIVVFDKPKMNKLFDVADVKLGYEITLKNNEFDRFVNEILKLENDKVSFCMYRDCDVDLDFYLFKERIEYEK